MAEKILIASSEASEIEAICSTLEDSFTTEVIASPDEYQGNLSEYDLLLLDQNFTDFQGVDFLMTVLVNGDTPALVLSAPDDAKSAGEALNVGAFNFVIKSDSYLDVLSFAISDAIKRFNDQKNLQDTIVNLKQNVAELETKASQAQAQAPAPAPAPVAPSSSPPAASASTPAPASSERNLLTDIVTTLKSGDVSLPIYPEISTRFKELMNRAASVREITELLQKDPGISSKMISVSNSSYYRGMAPIKTLEQAISRVGISETRNYVELISNRALYNTDRESYRDFLDGEWKHSLCCGYASQEISRAMQTKNPAELFAMGLFHNIGKILLVQILSKLENNGVYDEIPQDEWKALISKNHCQFGASLMKKWNLAEEYWLVAKWHENPDAAGSAKIEEINMVSLANLIARNMGYPDVGYEVEIDYTVLKCVAEIGITPDKIEEIKTNVAEMMEAGLVV